jgi:2-haloacid dehalogenase
MRGRIPSTAVFDLGGVFIDWNPRYLYRKLFRGDEAAVEHFLSTICTQDWNEQQDAGRTFAEGCAVLKAAHPAQSELIDAWFPGYEQMLGGEIQGSVEILSELHTNQTRLYALTNWSVETFPFAVRRFKFLGWFRGIVLSGEAKLLKPDPRLFRILFEKYAIDPTDAVYVDDRENNVDAAQQLGMHGIHFTDAGCLRRQLAGLGLL